MSELSQVDVNPRDYVGGDLIGDVYAPSVPTKRSNRLGALAPAKDFLRPTVVLALVWLLGLTFLAVFADRLPFVRGYAQVPADREARQEVVRYGKGPGWEYWFGTDKLGRDVFARCVYAAQKSLAIGAAAIIVGLLVGGLLGMIAGYYKGWTDRTLSTSFDVMLSFPALILALLIVGQWFNERRFLGVIVVLTLLSVGPLGRIVRAQSLALSQREYILAARGIGASNSRILIRELLPNIIPAMFAVTFTGLAILLVAEGGLAFLGYSVQLPFPTWGYMINEARPDIDKGGAWAVFFPCLFLFLTVLAFNVIGDRIARRFDIREATL
jgi:peptide/nickel transport system permease protein